MPPNLGKGMYPNEIRELPQNSMHRQDQPAGTTLKWSTRVKLKDFWSNPLPIPWFAQGLSRLPMRFSNPTVISPPATRASNSGTLLEVLWKLYGCCSTAASTAFHLLNSRNTRLLAMFWSLLLSTWGKASSMLLHLARCRALADPRFTKLGGSFQLETRSYPWCHHSWLAQPWFGWWNGYLQSDLR